MKHQSGQEFSYRYQSQWKVRLCLDPVRLNEALKQPVHRVPTLSYIFPKLSNAKYLSFIDACSRYHSLRFDEQSSYLTMV